MAATKQRRATTGKRRKQPGNGEPIAPAETVVAPPADVPLPSHDSPELAHITPALRALAVPIESLQQDSRNARKHNDRNRRAIRHSLTQFGQQRPISVDADGIILAGNGTHAEGIALGWKWIAAVKSHLRGAEARAYAIADNRSGELAEWDVQELKDTLEDLADQDFDVSGLEITEDEIDEMMADLEGDGSTKGSGSSKIGGDGEIQKQWKVVVTCEGEGDQVDFLNEMRTAGRKCKALIG
jgi:hypothetical protein